MLPQLRSFLAVVEEGSLHRAAVRLHLSQSALSRQMQALEQELGGLLLERASTGVKPTAGGFALAAKAGQLLAQYDTVFLEVRQLMQGESDTLRIGAIGTSVPEYLAPSLVALRQTHPKTRVTLLDLSPGEQIRALRRGEIDLALLNFGSELLARDFYTRRLATVPLAVHLSGYHPLAARKQLSLAELRDETFITGAQSEIPGYRRWITRLCFRLAKFRPSFVGQAESLTEALDLVVAQNAVLLLPASARHHTSVSVVTIPLVESEATTDLYLAWQRGRTLGALRSLLCTLRSPT